MQMGIVELREMLMGSNEEVENLREQMMLHQPAVCVPSSLPYIQSIIAERFSLRLCYWHLSCLLKQLVALYMSLKTPLAQYLHVDTC